MCKITAIAGLKLANKEQNLSLIFELSEIMSVDNNHGLGYAAIGKGGKLFGERWINNSDSWRQRGVKVPNFLSEHKDIIDGYIDGDTYNYFGDLESNMNAIILHTRYASSEINIENTHPFVDKDDQVALIHNGVINNAKTEDNIRSTCDSERILNQYLHHNVIYKPENMTDVCNELQGNMSCAVLCANDKSYIDLFRSRNDNLSGVYIQDLDIIVFTTTAYDVKRVAKNMKLKGLQKFKLKENMLVRLDATTGKIVLKQPFVGINKYQTEPINWSRKVWFH